MVASKVRKLKFSFQPYSLNSRFSKNERQIQFQAICHSEKRLSRDQILHRLLGEKKEPEKKVNGAEHQAGGENDRLEEITQGGGICTLLQPFICSWRLHTGQISVFMIPN
jgi:hypothetical protein